MTSSIIKFSVEKVVLDATYVEEKHRLISTSVFATHYGISKICSSLDTEPLELDIVLMDVINGIGITCCNPKP